LEQVGKLAFVGEILHNFSMEDLESRLNVAATRA
jgi:hypothetical protein